MDKHLPDLIITDFHLNHKESGLDIIHKALTPDGHQILTILVTGERLQLMSKPLTPDELLTQAYCLLAQ